MNIRLKDPDLADLYGRIDLQSRWVLRVRFCITNRNPSKPGHGASNKLPYEVPTLGERMLGHVSSCSLVSTSAAAQSAFLGFWLRNVGLFPRVGESGAEGIGIVHMPESHPDHPCPCSKMQAGERMAGLGNSRTFTSYGL